MHIGAVYFHAVVRCPQLNGSNAILNTTEVAYSTIVNITCSAGYRINYNDTSTNVICTADGSWSSNSISCSRKDFTLRQVLSYTYALSVVG